MAPNQKNEMGNKFWFTGLVNLKFALIFYLTEEDLKIFYNLKDIPVKALKAKSYSGWFG